MSSAMKTYKYKAVEEDHVHQLGEAFTDIVAQTSDISIISEDNQQSHSNRRFLSMFSRSLCDILGKIPETISPTIILPDCSSSSINNLLKIITGKLIDLENKEDWREMVKTADVLGIKIGSESLRFNNGDNVDPMVCMVVQSDNTDCKIEPMDSDNTEQIVSSPNEASGDVVIDNCYNKSNEINLDSSINSFLDTSSENNVLTSTPKQKEPVLDSNKNKSDSNENNQSKDIDSTDSSIQPPQIKQEPSNFKDVSPKELITKQSVHRICQIPNCAKNVPSMTKLRDHYVNHFWDEFVKKYGKYVDDKVCLLCSKVFGSRSSSLKHVAIWHSKINEVLTSKNYLPLPLQLNIKDHVSEADTSLKASLPLVEKSVEVANINEVSNMSIGPTPKKSCLLNKSSDRAKKRVSFGESSIRLFEKNDNSTRLFEQSDSENSVGETKPNDANEISDKVNQLLENSDQVDKSGTPEKETRKCQEEAIVGQNSSNDSTLKPHQIKKELFEFDKNIVPKNIVAEQSVHKICQVCQKEEPVLGKLRDHYVGHFIKEIEEKYGKFVSDKNCTLCVPPKLLNSKSAALRHIATWHSKVNSILTSKHLLPLPLTLNIKDTEQPGPTTPTKENSSPGQQPSSSNFPCQLCNQNQKSFSALRYHFYQQHFKNEVNTQFGHLADGETGQNCLVCKNEKGFKNRQATMNHIALIHSKINEVINEKGLQHLLVANPHERSRNPSGNTVNNSKENSVNNSPRARTLSDSSLNTPPQTSTPNNPARDRALNENVLSNLPREKSPNILPQTSEDQNKIELENSKPTLEKENNISSVAEPVNSEGDTNQLDDLDNIYEEVNKPIKAKTKDELLTEEFLKDRFLTKERTKSISERVKMTEAEVWKWFFNARQKKSEEIKAKIDLLNSSTNKLIATKAILKPDNGSSNSNKKQNSGFSDATELKLKKEFFISRILNKERTQKIASELKLSEEQIEKWFSERTKAVSVAAFTAGKVKKLNHEFSQSQDLSRQRSKSLAQQLGLGEKQIIQWFTTKTRSNNYSRGVAKENQATVNKINQYFPTSQFPVNGTNGASLAPVNKINGITQANKMNGTPQASVIKTNVTPQASLDKTNSKPQTTAKITPQASPQSTNLTINQLLRLEKEFNNNQLKNKEIRKKVAEEINLKEKDVEQWLQKRVMVRKQFAGKGDNSTNKVNGNNAQTNQSHNNKRSAETEPNREVKRAKIDDESMANKVMKTEKDIKTEKDTVSTGNSEQKSTKGTHFCDCGDSFLSDEAFSIHKTYTCKNIS